MGAGLFSEGPQPAARKRRMVIGPHNLFESLAVRVVIDVPRITFLLLKTQLFLFSCKRQTGGEIPVCGRKIS